MNSSRCVQSCTRLSERACRRICFQSSREMSFLFDGPLRGTRMGRTITGGWVTTRERESTPVRKALPIQVLTEPPNFTGADVALRAWTTRTRSESSSSPPGPNRPRAGGTARLLRQPPRPRTAPRGGRDARWRERRLLHPLRRKPGCCAASAAAAPPRTQRGERDAFTKLASSCTILSLPGDHRQFCGAMTTCPWTSFARYWNGMCVPI